MIPFKVIFLLLGFLTSFSYSLVFAQIEQIGPGHHLSRVSWHPNPSVSSRSTHKDTLFITAAQPFFDDFSHPGSVPDSTLWDIHAGDGFRHPNIMRNSAIGPPSLGVAMFDGVSANNDPYSRRLTRGPGDRLESHYFDLSGLDPDSDVWLTFFLQPEGFGDAPTSQDSFKVYMNALVAPGKDSLITVYRQGGSRVKDFEQITLNIGNPIFFHPHFYIVFEVEGLQAGVLNLWHLDYVNLGLQRTPGDTIYQDRSVCYLTRPPMDPYTAIPYQQYVTGTSGQSPFGVVMSNLTGQSSNVTINTQMIDVVGGNIFSPAFQNQAVGPVNSLGSSDLSFTAYSASSGMLAPDSATLRHEVKFSSNNDNVSENDIFYDYYRIDSIMAYDDGEIDAGYGLNRSRGFGQRFEIGSQDSLMAVWIAFAPQIDYFRGGSLLGQDFRLTVWFDDHPDSVLYQQISNMTIQYGDTANHFERYRLRKPISLKGTVYIGVTQLTDAPIGVGYDLTYNNNNYVYYDSVGKWTNSRLNGTLMIRPEFWNIDYHPGPFTQVDQHISTQSALLNFYPNPLKTRNLNFLSLQQALPATLQVTLIDLNGRRVYTHSLIASELAAGQLMLPPTLSSGLYLIRYEGRLESGQDIQGSSKLMIE